MIVHCVEIGFGEGGRYGNGLFPPKNGGKGSPVRCVNSFRIILSAYF